MKYVKIPDATITRLSIYSRALEDLARGPDEVVSSKKLAEICGVNPAQIRKDLAYFGQFGVRGVGYFIQELMFDIKKILGLNKNWNLALVGAGNLGMALLAHESFAAQGYRFVCAFDVDPQKVGRHVSPQGFKISHVDYLEQTCRLHGVEIGVICTTPDKAQDVATRLQEVPVLGILNFAPVQLQCPKGVQGCRVENVDFSVKLDNLAYHLTAG